MHLGKELIVDVVKEELGKKADMGKEEMNDWVIRKTVGGPLRCGRRTMVCSALR